MVSEKLYPYFNVKIYYQGEEPKSFYFKDYLIPIPLSKGLFVDPNSPMFKDKSLYKQITGYYIAYPSIYPYISFMKYKNFYCNPFYNEIDPKLKSLLLSNYDYSTETLFAANSQGHLTHINQRPSHFFKPL